MNRLNEKIDNLGTDMQWMKNALIEWAQAIDHDDQTNSLIEKYCKEDRRVVEVSKLFCFVLRDLNKISLRCEMINKIMDKYSFLIRHLRCEDKRHKKRL